MNSKQLLSILYFFCVFSNATSQEIHYQPTSNGEVIKHQHYSLSYLEQYEQPEWVAYYITPEMLAKKAARKDRFIPDPNVKTGSATKEDYDKSGYDLGHLLPCRNMQFDCDAMFETFYLSNMSPQQPRFNRYYWSQFEQLERNMAWRNGGAFIISGAVLHPELPTIGKVNQIAVPELYYKIICANDFNQRLKVIAFLIPNEYSKDPLISKVVSVDSIETLTGIDFFPQLDDKLEDSLEYLVKLNLWDFSNPNSNYGYKHKAKKCKFKKTKTRKPKKVNINTATAQELETIPGIGKTKARAIIAKRPFKKASDLKNVKGIGEVSYSKLKRYISVK